MRTYGAKVTPSPSESTAVGRKILADHPGTTGSLGCAISEAVEAATSREGYRYVLGSVLSQVLLHQSIIGLETKTAMDKYGITPDIIIGCAGGGSNLGGLISPFMGEKLRGEDDYRFIAVEPASCPSLTRGRFAYDFCDTGMVCPLSKMYTLGSGFIPSANHAGGLRYHGMSSVLSELYDQGLMEARSVEQTEVFKAAEDFARIEGILPAPESSHAIKAAMDEALKCKETGEEKTILRFPPKRMNRIFLEIEAGMVGLGLLIYLLLGPTVISAWIAGTLLPVICTIAFLACCELRDGRLAFILVTAGLDTSICDALTTVFVQRDHFLWILLKVLITVLQTLLIWKFCRKPLLEMLDENQIKWGQVVWVPFSSGSPWSHSACIRRWRKAGEPQFFLLSFSVSLRCCSM